MTSAGILPINNQARPPYVRWALRAVRDHAASVAEGYEVTKDAYFALITPSGSRDCVDKLAEDWLKEIKIKSRSGDPSWPPQFIDHFERSFDEFKAGNEIPAFGTPVRGSLILQPSDQQRCISANVLTLEDLADANEGALSRIGMGARALKDKAAAWVKTKDDNGNKLAIENQALRVEVEQLTEALESANGKIKQLESELNRKK